MSKNKPAITKSELISDLASKTSLHKNQIKDVFEALESIVEKYIKNGIPVVIPNLCKIYVHKRPASSARQMKSPATGEMISVSAKPARKVVKVKAVKNLKEML